MSFTPIIIIGAPRSGTNILRDVLTRLTGFATWPCDEINYIWRHGHTNYSTDEFPATFADKKTRRYIEGKFAWVSKKYNVNNVVEKTCANSLRVEYLYKILPDAKFIFIYRNGFDVVGSAMKRWKAPLNIKYIAKKIRFVPVSDLPIYGAKYFFNRAYRFFSKDNRLSVWGPRFKNMHKLKESPLDEICALQWKACVNSSYKQSMVIPEKQKIIVSYEDFVNDPISTLQTILDTLSIEHSVDEMSGAVSRVSNKSVNKGLLSLSDEQRLRLENLIGSSLAQHGYS